MDARAELCCTLVNVDVGGDAIALRKGVLGCRAEKLPATKASGAALVLSGIRPCMSDVLRSRATIRTSTQQQQRRWLPVNTAQLGMVKMI